MEKEHFWKAVHDYFSAREWDNMQPEETTKLVVEAIEANGGTVVRKLS